MKRNKPKSRKKVSDWVGDLHTEKKKNNNFQRSSKPFDFLIVFWHCIHSAGLNR